MRFDLLLKAMEWLLRLAGLLSADFKTRLQGPVRHVRLMTTDNRHGRTFAMGDGRVRSFRDKRKTPDGAMAWLDAAVAFKVLSGGYEGDFYDALQAGRVKISGDAGRVFSFISTVRQAKDVFRGLRNNPKGSKQVKRST